jgi:hypothetical protein
VHPEITPDPTSEEREAILGALEELRVEEPVPDASRSAWWREGLRESVEDETD